VREKSAGPGGVRPGKTSEWEVRRAVLRQAARMSYSDFSWDGKSDLHQLLDLVVSFLTVPIQSALIELRKIPKRTWSTFTPPFIRSFLKGIPERVTGESLGAVRVPED